MKNRVLIIVKKIKTYINILPGLFKKAGEHLVVVFEKIEKHLEKHKNTYSIIGKILYSIYVFILKLLEVALFIVASIWNAVTQSFLFNIIFSFLTIIVLLYFLFRIAPHTGNVSFSGEKEDTYINTTAERVVITSQNLSDHTIAGIDGEVYVLYCRVNDNKRVSDYEIIRLKGDFEYTALYLNQLASSGIKNEDNHIEWFDDELTVVSETSSDTNETMYELKNSFHDYLENETYSYHEVDDYFNNLLVQWFESSTIYSKILQEIRGFKTNQREVNFRYFSSEDTCSIESSSIYCYCSGYKVRPLAGNCQIEILDPEASNYLDNENTGILKTIPIKDDFIIYRSDKFDFKYGGCLCITNGSCAINYQECDPIITIEGSKGIQSEITGDFNFYYSNEPTTLELHNRILDIESRYGLLDIVIGEDEADENSLSIEGEITRGFVSGINLFPSFNSWYRNNVYLVPLTLISTIFTCVTLMQSKKKTTSSPSWNPFDVKKEEPKKDNDNQQPPTLIIKVVSQSPIDASILKDATMKENRDADINPSTVPEELDDDYIDEHPECAD